MASEKLYRNTLNRPNQKKLHRYSKSCFFCFLQFFFCSNINHKKTFPGMTVEILALINLPLFFLWNEDNNNFEWLKMGKWVTKCSVNILAPWTPGVSRKQTYSPRGCTQWMKRRELAFSQGHREHSWVERRELGLLSDWREWASTNLAPGGIIGGSWPPKIESMGARV